MSWRDMSWGDTWIFIRDGIYTVFVVSGFFVLFAGLGWVHL